MSVLYTDHDAQVCAWLGELVRQGHLAPGRVLPHDIRRLTADDIAGYQRVHLFAGIGGWELALQLAGWPDELTVFTGSCPCQPFSVAGSGRGAADERHLWPEMRRLVAECRPTVVAGEQVASPAGRAWLAAVRTDLEALGYAVGAADLCAAGVGAPHMRQRLYWVAERLDDATGARHDRAQQGPEAEARDEARMRVLRSGSRPGRLADSSRRGFGEPRSAPGQAGHDDQRGEVGGLGNAQREFAGRDAGTSAGEEGGSGVRAERDDARAPSATGRLEHSNCAGPRQGHQAATAARQGVSVIAASRRGRPSAHHGGWSAADWLFCRDGKWRPVESAAQRMANGLSLCLGSMRRMRVGEKEEALSAENCIGLGRETLRALRETNDAEAFWLSAGGRFGFPQATFLLAILCEYSRELGVVSDSKKACGPQDVEGFLRTLRQTPSAASCSSQRSKRSEQLICELGDAVSKLSQNSAQLKELMKSLASYTAGPLANNLNARALRLRGYGNAIVPQVAAEFLMAYLETRE